jgi:hypothetical protein
MAEDIRNRLVSIALEWQEAFGVAPQITSAISELDAARLVGMELEAYKSQCGSKGAVQRGHDFTYAGCKYQVKANRPSGRKNSKVKLVPKSKNFKWDKLIWILYDRDYVMQEAWEWRMQEYRDQFEALKNVHPAEMRKGRQIYTIQL